MSRTGHAVRISVVGASLLALATSAAHARQENVAGVVKNAAGSAIVVTAGRETPARPGQAVSEGDTLRTGADGRLGLTLKDGTRLSLGANTELKIESFAYAPAEGRLAVVIRLLRGATGYISGRIARLAPGAVKIETPSSVIGIRGTHLLIGVGQP